MIEKYEKLLSEIPQKIDAMDAWLATAFVMILNDLQSLKQSMQEQSKKLCKACLWKKQVSVFTGDSVWAADFPWDKIYIVEKWGIKMIDCKRCNGTGEEPQLNKSQTNPTQKETVEIEIIDIVNDEDWYIEEWWCCECWEENFTDYNYCINCWRKIIRK